LRTIGTSLAVSSGVEPVAATTLRPPKRGRRFDVQLRAVERATCRYRDLDAALDHGYELLGPYVPAMGWHLFDFEQIEQTRTHGPTLTQPSALTYTIDGELGAVEYVVPTASLDGDEPPDLFADESASVQGPSERAGWHVHGAAQHVFSNHDGEYAPDPSREALLTPENWFELSDSHPRFPPAQPDLEPGDELIADVDGDGNTERWGVVDRLVSHPDVYTLHVWVHHENPHGVFAGFNPAFDRFDPPDGGHDHDHDHDHDH
jgi:hypothetical protein